MEAFLLDVRPGVDAAAWLCVAWLAPLCASAGSSAANVTAAAASQAVIRESVLNDEPSVMALFPGLAEGLRLRRYCLGARRSACSRTGHLCLLTPPGFEKVAVGNRGGARCGSAPDPSGWSFQHPYAKLTPPLRYWPPLAPHAFLISDAE